MNDTATEAEELEQVPEEVVEETTPTAAKRAERAFGPIVGGAILDFMDLATFGPVGLIIGAAVGYWIMSIYRLPKWHRIIGAFLAGWYCMLPFTRFVPLATLVGAYVRYQDSGRRKSQVRSPEPKVEETEL
jgi:hypothetical protein